MEIHIDQDIIFRLVTALIVAISLYVRLEYLSKQNKKDIEINEKNMRTEINVLWSKYESLDEKHQNLDDKVMSKLSEVEKSLARIEGKLGVNN